MKITTVCAGGQVRSVAAKVILTEHGHDVLAVGVGNNKPETVKMLCDWADRVVLMDNYLRQFLPEGISHKLVICDIGSDVWGNPFHQELQTRIRSMNLDQLCKL